MNPLVLGPLLDLGGKLFDRIFPDKVGQAKQRAEAELALRQLALDAEDRIAKNLAASDSGQIEVNKIEAAAPDLFRGGWRPAVGWVCVIALAVQFVARPLLPWIVQIAGGAAPEIPPLDLTELLTLLFGMLGLGALRTYEKRSGVA